MSTGPSQDQRIGPLVIAHRGASAYLPEHTLAAKALAYGFGADFLEQDVVASRDDHLIVLHDIHLDRVTDVVERFPGRARTDGRWYVRDFYLQELRSLTVWERMTPERDATVYPGRFPHRQGSFRIATLADELQMITTLNRATGRRVGIYPEVKRPAWHHAEGVDLSSLLLDELDRAGYSRRADPVYLQCFDPLETRRIREELGSELRLVQLLGDNGWQEAAADFDALRTASGLARIAEYADAIGPWVNQLYARGPVDDAATSTGLLELAHEHGLAVHAYTFRADDLAVGFSTYETMLRWFADTLGIDGLFTDVTDLTLRLVGRPGHPPAPGNSGEIC